jgi:hypothetical protein
MLALFKKVFKDSKNGLIGYGIGFLVYSLIMAVIYPMFSKTGINLDSYIKQYPEAFMKAF